MWTPANLSGLGDADLAASCVSSPGSSNPARVICGGIMFANAQYAMSWPGAALIRSVPTVNNTLPDPAFPTAFPLWGVDAAVMRGETVPATVTKPLGKDVAPAQLVAPMPSITPVNPASGTTTDQDGGIGCQLSGFASRNPGMAVMVALGLYMLLKGGAK